MSFLDRVLDPPSYRYVRDGKLYIPTRTEIFKEFLRRLNIIEQRNWLSFFTAATDALAFLAFFMFLFFYFSWPLLAITFVYGMFVLGSHANFWVHRYCAHRAFTFKNSWYRAICRNLVIKIVPEEIHVVSHHVHHQKSDTPGDPYNVNGGWLYCFLADEIHQGIRKDLTEAEYDRVSRMLKDTGIKINNFKQYQRWGSICHPMFTFGHYLLNWSFWFTIFYLIGGTPLLMAILGACGLWVFGRRTFAFRAHGAGRDQRKEGVDFDHAVSAVNRIWTGFVAGEWHNNHHLYPNSARSGFLPYQLDLPWIMIRCLYSIGWVSAYRDHSSLFYERHYYPYLQRIQASQR